MCIEISAHIIGNLHRKYKKIELNKYKRHINFLINTESLCI